MDGTSDSTLISNAKAPAPEALLKIERRVKRGRAALQRLEKRLAFLGL